MQRARNAIIAILVGPAVLLGGAASASAQQPGAPPPGPRQGGWVSAAGGASFSSQVEAGPTFAGEFGDDIHPNVQAFVTVSYFDDVMAQDLRDDLAALSAGLTARTGTAWDLRGRDRAVTFIAGGRYLFGSPGAARPYVGGGAGVINLRRSIADPRAGDVTAAVLSEFGVGNLSLATATLTRPLVEGALGIAFFSGPVYVDVGYRYKRAFHLTETTDFSQAVVGIGYRF